jgi:hypothetical protein
MPNGSNQYTKSLVQAGTLCYVCEQATPTLVGDIGSPLCQDCHTHMQTHVLKHILKSGYRVRKARQP